jgi:1,4-alpha-glucan branching enzyme
MILLAKGYVSLILHAHLPYVRHPESENFIEERWLFEALSESYIPILKSFETLLDEKVKFKITISITPTLLTMLSDKLLQERYIKYLNKMIELSEKEISRTRHQPYFNRLAVMYHEKYKNNLKCFETDYGMNIIKGFARLQDEDVLEIIGCPATHGFLPLLSINPQSVKAQISIGVKTHERFFGRRPTGLWLPECGYIPDAETYFKQSGIEYLITESHGILFSSPRPVFGTYAPIATPNGIVVFGRDSESSKQVWSSTEGYPGDYCYREFYRDIGFDLDYDYIKDYISPDGKRIYTGIKYYRITGKTDCKEPYNPEWAENRAKTHAADFMFNKKAQIENLSSKMDRPPIIVCPYDAELFGHWWYEGPIWLYSLIKKSYLKQNTFELVSLKSYISENPVMQVAAPAQSTWGNKGYNEIWLNASNDWIYKHLHKSAERMTELANTNVHAEGVKKDALNQAARELLLAQSSDWAFIIRMGTMARYAEMRIKDHLGRFTRLYNEIKENSIDKAWLSEIQYRDSIFPDIDYTEYCTDIFSP